MYTDVAFSLSLRLLRWTTENVVCFEFPFCMLKARKHFCPTAVRWAFFLHFYSQLQKWPLPLWISRLLFFSFLSMPKIVFVKQGTTAAAAAATHGLNSEGIHFKLYPWTLEAAVVRTRLLQDFLSESMIFFSAVAHRCPPWRRILSPSIFVSIMFLHFFFHFHYFGSEKRAARKSRFYFCFSRFCHAFFCVFPYFRFSIFSCRISPSFTLFHLSFSLRCNGCDDECLQDTFDQTWKRSAKFWASSVVCSSCSTLPFFFFLLFSPRMCDEKKKLRWLQRFKTKSVFFIFSDRGMWWLYHENIAHRF